MLVTGFDDRDGCGYVLGTGSHGAAVGPTGVVVTHDGRSAVATVELAARLRYALAQDSCPQTLADPDLLRWLHEVVGGVLSVQT